MTPIQNNTYNSGIHRNAIIFAVLTLILHTIACFMYGFFFKLTPDSSNQGRFYPVFIAFAHGFLVLVGNSYTSKDLGFFFRI